MKSMLDSMLERLGGWLLPPSCVLCGASGQAPCLDLCGDCHDELPAVPAACPRCAARTALAAASPEPCERCAASPPPYTRCHAAFRYATPVDGLVQALKYRGQLTISRVLGELLARSVGRAGLASDVILPVPLHPLRHAERGFNQATEIARWTARRLEICCDPTLATRRVAGSRQVGLSAVERRLNLQGAFTADGPRVRGRYIALLDDVLTTGSTAAALADALLRAGAARVDVWCVALADQPHGQPRG
jgi:ComF family protein